MHAKTKIALPAALVLLFAAFAAPSASASFGFEPGSVDALALGEDGNAYSQAAGHPATITTEFKLNTEVVEVDDSEKGPTQEIRAEGGPLRNVTVEAPPGLIGNPMATPRCSLTEFLGKAETEPGAVACPDNTQVGIAKTDFQQNFFGPDRRKGISPLYNLRPQQGQPALFGFTVAGTPILAAPNIRESDYGIDFNVLNIDQTVHVLSNEFTFWGNPASSNHDRERGQLEQDDGVVFSKKCSDGRELGAFEKLFNQFAEENHEPLPYHLNCPSGIPERAFLTNPTDCQHGPFEVTVEAQSWTGPRDSETLLSHDIEGNPTGVTHCERVSFDPSIEVSTSNENAQSPTGLDFAMEIPDSGLVNPEGRAQANLRKAVVTLPEGFTLNPSAGEGLGYCAEAQYASEKLHTPEGAGCPNSSRLGSVTIDSPLLEQGELAEGSLFVAQPQQNPFGSLVAMYMVARVPDRGVIVKAAGKVDLDPKTGQITTTFDGLPQLPFSTFKLHFREGGRAPLATPPSCGPKTTVAKLYPYSDPSTPTEVGSVSVVTDGPDGGACPKGGLPPFRPGLTAGSLNSAAGRFSPFYARLFRSDSEQEITHFSIKLPPGLVGKLAGVPFCPDAGIAQAKAREHIGGGKEEQVVPSCPAASQIGRTLVGAGVGSILTYVPGKVYLAGPYHGSPLSIVAITAGVVGPFDIGTVEVREALRINPETAEVFIDATGSDPIPHIIQGIAVHARDIRVYIDRPDFVLNPTSCEPTSTASTVLGSGLDFASEADDEPVTVTSRFQAADCASLGFKPRLSLSLKGKTKRNGNPALRAVLRPRIGDANASRISVRLPHSEFLDQGHIRTVCTRVQFRAGAGNGTECPSGSIYGQAKVWTPLFSQPLEGPVFLRSSEHPLPDLVLALHGLVDIDAVGRIDSVKGGIRNTFDFVPDAPVTKVVLNLQGGKKGLLVNSTDICRGTHKAVVKMEGHNGRLHHLRTPLKASCGKGGKHHRRSRKG